VVERALARARERRADLEASLFDFLGVVMLGALDDEPCGRAAVEARMQLQQLTGPVRAKGVEDTAFYRHLRFVALNEVGGAPDRFGVADAGDFHAHCRRIQSDWPRTMLGLSSHDSKRSEDVRARLYALSEIPERWETLVRRWTRRHASHRRTSPWPDAAIEYLIYQTLVGAWPLSLERALAYFEKAAREARIHTSWTDPDPAYDEALARFVEALYEDELFRGELEELVGRLQRPGRVNSLAQKLLQLTAPGVPDLYQGSELWDLSLVDPDNRRPVDFGLRRGLLRELEGLDAEGVWARADEGLPKLWVVSKALGVRAQRPTAFGPKGAYEPLVAAGEASEHVVAYCRGGEVLPIVPRKVIGLEARGGFRGTTLELPAGRWSDVLSGAVHPSGTVLLEDLLARFPVALLVRDEEVP
jgi:(1->4)-alpha-D-glucan 1-alpha-D-glucosylmutase